MAGFTRRMAERIMDATVRVERSDLGQRPKRRKWPKARSSRAWFGELTADLSSSSTATFQRQKWNGSAYENVGDPVTCRAETTFSDGPIPSGTEGAVEKRDGVWWLIRIYWCPAA